MYSSIKLIKKKKKHENKTINKINNYMKQQQNRN